MNKKSSVISMDAAVSASNGLTQKPDSGVIALALWAASAPAMASTARSAKRCIVDMAVPVGEEVPHLARLPLNPLLTGSVRKRTSAPMPSACRSYELGRRTWPTNLDSLASAASLSCAPQPDFAGVCT